MFSFFRFVIRVDHFRSNYKASVNCLQKLSPVCIVMGSKMQTTGGKLQVRAFLLYIIHFLVLIFETSKVIELFYVAFNDSLAVAMFCFIVRS